MWLARLFLSLLTGLRRTIVAALVSPRILTVFAIARRLCSAWRTLARRRMRQIASTLVATVSPGTAIFVYRLGLSTRIGASARIANIA